MRLQRARVRGLGRRAECSRWDRYLQAKTTAGEGNSKREVRETRNQRRHKQVREQSLLIQTGQAGGDPWGAARVQQGEGICWVFWW